jgi:hypothetical protein
MVVELTWKCDICMEVRKDKFISVKEVPLVFRGKSSSFKKASRNIKYCNDKQDCIDRVNRIKEFLI